MDLLPPLSRAALLPLLLSAGDVAVASSILAAPLRHQGAASCAVWAVSGVALYALSRKRLVWQGVPAAVASLLLLALHLSTPTSHGGSPHPPLPWSAILLLLLSGALLPLLTAAALLLFPPMPIPALRGPYKTVGCVGDVWVRALPPSLARTQVGGATLGRTRRCPVQIFYPSSADEPAFESRALLWTTGGSNAAAQLRDLLTDFCVRLVGLPAVFGWLPLSHLAHARARYVHAAPLSADRERWPVILYSHGLFGWKSYSASSCSELASRGYIVVAVDHVGDSICSCECAGDEGTTGAKRRGDAKGAAGLPSSSLSSGGGGGDEEDSGTAAAEAEEARVSSPLPSPTPSPFTLFSDGPAFIAQPLDEQRKVYLHNARLRHTDLLHIARRLLHIAGASSAHVWGKEAGDAGGGGGEGAEDRVNPPPPPPANARVLSMFAGRLRDDGFGVFGHSYGAATGILAVSSHGRFGPVPAGAEEVAPDAGQGSAEAGPSKLVEDDTYLVEPRDASVPATVWQPAPGPEAREPVFRAAVALDPFLWAVPESATVGDAVGNPFDGLADFWDASGAHHEAVAHAARKVSPEQLELAAASVATTKRGAPCLILCSDDAGGWEYGPFQRPFLTAVVRRLVLQEERHEAAGGKRRGEDGDGEAPALPSTRVEVLPGFGHSNFTDLPLVCHPHLLRRAKRIGTVKPLVAMAEVAARTAAYFETHMPV
jgi:hypothetical protein